MKIVIDTNILRQDILLTSRKFEMLIDYIKKTRHEIILPNVVYEEIIALYTRNLKNKIDCLDKSYTELEKSVIIPLAFNRPNVDTDKQVEKFIENLKSKLRINDNNIISTNNGHLPNLVNRAINRIHPFTEKKVEFRDALIWLTILDLAEYEDTKTIVFISGNTKEFSSKNGGLHPVLLEEANAKNVIVEYHSSLDDFISINASKIEFITKAWLEKNINVLELENQLIVKLETSKNIKTLEIMISRLDNKYTELNAITQCTNTWLNSYYIYEMSDGTIRVEANFETEVEIEYLVRDLVNSDFAIDYNIESYIDKIEYDYVYPIIELEVHIIIEENKIVSTELVDIYI